MIKEKLEMIFAAKADVLSPGICCGIPSRWRFSHQIPPT
jgi:hypothetical protein